MSTNVNINKVNFLSNNTSNNQACSPVRPYSSSNNKILSYSPYNSTISSPNNTITNDNSLTNLYNFNDSYNKDILSNSTSPNTSNKKNKLNIIGNDIEKGEGSTNKILMSDSKIINLNINYNSHNSLNKYDNDSSHDSSNDKYNTYKPKNINEYLDDASRIHTNSNWIYGEKAWTNNPDFYIPQKKIIKKQF